MPPELFYVPPGLFYGVLISLTILTMLDHPNDYRQSSQVNPQKTTLWANESLSEPQKVPKFHIEGPKCILLVATIHLEHYLTIGTKSGDSGPFESNFSWSFQRPKGQILDYLRPKRAWFAQKMAFWRPLKGSKYPKLGQWCVPSEAWPVGPFCGM